MKQTWRNAGLIRGQATTSAVRPCRLDSGNLLQEAQYQTKLLVSEHSWHVRALSTRNEQFLQEKKRPLCVYHLFNTTRIQSQSHNVFDIKTEIYGMRPWLTAIHGEFGEECPSSPTKGDLKHIASQ